ncbi:MAG: penicillin-binding protein 1A [Chakrabartia sp.]
MALAIPASLLHRAAQLRLHAVQAWGWFRQRYAQPRFRRLVRLLGALLLLYALFWLLFARGLPSAETLLTYQPPLPTYVRDVNGTPVHSYARERRVELRYEEYPPKLVEAFISAEDKTFFSHGGIDFPGLVGAVVDYVSKIGSGERARGGSTITQQVAKNLLLGNEYSVTRKIKEAILARRIESVLTKEQILELYLNQIPLGRNSFGVQAAARAYFNKDVADLNLSEMAFLAILPKAPETYGRPANANKALIRRDYVLREMRDNGYITDAQYRTATATPLGILPRAATAPNLNMGGYFLEEVRRQLIEKFGETSEDGPYSVYDGGLWVRTSINPDYQRYAEKALRDGLVRYESGKGWRGPITKIEPGSGWPQRLAALNLGAGYADWRIAAVLDKAGDTATIGFSDGTTGILPASAAAMPRRGTATAAFRFLKPGAVIAVKREGNSYALRSIPEVSGGMVVQDPHTGRVLAMQGGFDVRLASYNRATQAQRQPGSTFKPFVYAAALDAGMTPAEIIIDGPFCVYQSAKLGRKCFKNFDGGGSGPRTMRWGLEQSRNLMTVRAASQTGMARVVKMADVMGISPPKQPYPELLSIALGAGDTTVINLVNAYSILASNGRERHPTLIDYVQDRDGKVRWRADTRRCDGCNAPDWNGSAMPRPPARMRQVIDPQTAYQVVHMLEGVIQRGTAVQLRDLNRPLFGKTGTTSGPTNVWFVGGSPDLVAGLYMGFDQPRNMGGYVQGSTYAVPIFKDFALKAMADLPIVPFRAPPGIRMIRIERMSGKRVYGAWPTDDPKSPVIWEAFKPESEPRRTIRRDELEAQKKKAEQALSQDSGRAGQRRDTDFLQREGGIY